MAGNNDDETQMERSGSNAFVARRLNRGDTPEQVLRALDRQFNDYTSGAQRRAYNAGLQSWQAGSAINELTVPPPGLPIPTSGGPPSEYVSTVLVTLDNVPGVPGGRAVREFQLVTPTQPSRIGLLDEARRYLEEIKGQQPAREGYEEWTGASVHEIEIISVERGRA